MEEVYLSHGHKEAKKEKEARLWSSLTCQGMLPMTKLSPNKPHQLKVIQPPNSTIAGTKPLTHGPSWIISEANCSIYRLN
jgi:hypothetical protein